MSRRLVAALMLLVLSLTACSTPHGRTGTDAGMKDPAPLTVWVGPSPSLHPHVANPHITAALFSSLVTTVGDDPSPRWGSAVNDALLVDISSSDQQRWDLTIKEGWTWHDGQPVVADDVERGWRAAIDAGLPVTSTITDIRVRDKQTISVALRAPYGQLPSLLMDPAFLPLPPLAEDAPARFAEAPIGNGPYRLAGRDGELLIIHAHPDHPGNTARTDELGIARSEQPQEGHEVLVLPDGVPEPPAGADHPWLIRHPGRQLAYMGFPLSDPRYADDDVRAALSLAIDRDALASTVLASAVTPADRLIGPGLPRAADVECVLCDFAPDEAAQRWPDDFEGPLTLWFAADSGHEPVIEFLAESWRTHLGVEDIQLASLPAEDLLDRLRAAEVSGPFRLSWAADVVSPSRVLQPLFGPRGNANDFRFRDAAVGDLIDAGDLAADPDAALAAYAIAEEAVLDALPLIPLWFSTITVLHADGVDVDLRADGTVAWTTLG